MDIFLRNEQLMIFFHGLLNKIVRTTGEHDTENTMFLERKTVLWGRGGVEPGAPDANFKGTPNSSLQ